MYKLISYGAFFENESTRKYRKIGSPTIDFIQKEKHYNHLYSNFDWYEWSIDSTFIQKYKNILVLVIGEKDVFISVNRTSIAISLCQVIYTKTKHGLVLFSNVLNEINLFPAECTV